MAHDRVSLQQALLNRQLLDTAKVALGRLSRFDRDQGHQEAIAPIRSEAIAKAEGKVSSSPGA